MALEDTLSGIREASAKRGSGDQGRRPAAELRAAKCLRTGGALARSLDQRTTGLDLLSRRLVTLLQCRAVCFAACDGRVKGVVFYDLRDHAAAVGRQPAADRKAQNQL